MEERRTEAFLDTLARKMIADELRLFYCRMEGDIPTYLLDVLKTMEGQANQSRER
jgi:hypothetical protein